MNRKRTYWRLTQLWTTVVVVVVVEDAAAVVDVNTTTLDKWWIMAVDAESVDVDDVW